MVLFVIRPDLLDQFGNFFGIARGADLIVYVAIVVLMYVYIELVNKTTKQNILFTKLVTNLALKQEGSRNELWQRS